MDTVAMRRSCGENQRTDVCIEQRLTGGQAVLPRSHIQQRQHWKRLLKKNNGIGSGPSTSTTAAFPGDTVENDTVREFIAPDAIARTHRRRCGIILDTMYNGHILPLDCR
jgi:hypothetical protein